MPIPSTALLSAIITHFGKDPKKAKVEAAFQTQPNYFEGTLADYLLFLDKKRRTKLLVRRIRDMPY